MELHAPRTQLRLSLLANAALAGATGLAILLARNRRKACEKMEALAQQRRRIGKLALRLLADPLPDEAPDAAYLFHQLDCNLDSMIVAVQELARKYPGLLIILFDVRNNLLKYGIPNGFGGGPLLLKRLRASGVAESQLRVLPWNHERDTGIHTLVEAERAVHYAKKQGWKSLLVVAPPWHLPRAAMTAASAAIRHHPELSVLSYRGGPMPWEEKAVHSQGMVATRFDFLSSEMDRIERYTSKGDIAPCEQLEKCFKRATLES